MGRCKRHSAVSVQPASRLWAKNPTEGPSCHTALINLVSRMDVEKKRMDVGPNQAPQEFVIRGLRLGQLLWDIRRHVNLEKELPLSPTAMYPVTQKKPGTERRRKHKEESRVRVRVAPPVSAHGLAPRLPVRLYHTPLLLYHQILISLVPFPVGFVDLSPKEPWDNLDNPPWALGRPAGQLLYNL